MTEFLPGGKRLTGKRGPALLAVLAMFTAMAFLAAGTAPAAQADEFCKNAYLQPYGQYGDRCDMLVSQAGHFFEVGIQTSGRAGCVRIIGYYGEPVTNWQCTSAWSHTSILRANDGGYYRGSIRNNNSTYGAYFSGFNGCCYP